MSAAPDGRTDLVRRMLSQHHCADAVERRALNATLDLLGAVAEPFARATLPGHITASAIVLDESRARVLVVWHAGLARWLQPGGHCEPDDVSLAATAIREVAEETGVRLERDAAQPPLVHVDVHPIPARGAEAAHRHHDLRFAFTVAAHDAPALVEGTSSGWVRVDELAALGSDTSLRAAVARAARALEVCAGHREPEAAN